MSQAGVVVVARTQARAGSAASRSPRSAGAADLSLRKEPWLLLTPPVFVRADRIRSFERQGDVIEAVQETVLSVCVDIEREGFPFRGRHDLRCQIDVQAIAGRLRDGGIAVRLLTARVPGIVQP